MKIKFTLSLLFFIGHSVELFSQLKFNDSTSFNSINHNQVYEVNGIFNFSRFTPKRQLILDHIASYLKSDSSIQVIFYTKSDSLGSLRFNYRLTENQAQSIGNYLTSKAILENQFYSTNLDYRNILNPKMYENSVNLIFIKNLKDSIRSLDVRKLKDSIPYQEFKHNSELPWLWLPYIDNQDSLCGLHYNDILKYLLILQGDSSKYLRVDFRIYKNIEDPYSTVKMENYIQTFFKTNGIDSERLIIERHGFPPSDKEVEVIFDIGIIDTKYINRTGLQVYLQRLLLNQFDK